MDRKPGTPSWREQVVRIEQGVNRILRTIKREKSLADKTAEEKKEREDMENGKPD